MMTSGEAQQHSGELQPDLSVYPKQPKRVPRACDPCRKKRIKCSAGQRPCMNCLLYRATCTDTPIGASRAAHRARRNRSLASLVARDGSRQHQDPGGEGFVEEAGPLSPQSSGRAPTVVSLGDESLVQPLQPTQPTQPTRFDQPSQSSQPNGAVQITQGLSLDGQDEIPRTEAFLTSYEPWDSNLFMPNIFDFADSPDIPDLTDSMLTELPGFNTIFPDTQERPPTRAVRDDVDRGSRPISSTTRQPKVAGVHFLKDGLSSWKSASLLPGLFLKKDTRESRYQGLNSIGGTLSSCLIYAQNKSPELRENSLLQYLIQGITYMDEANIPAPPKITLQDLPDRSLVEYGVESFFRSVYLRYPVVSLELRYSWAHWYDGSNESPDPIQFWCVCIMVAIGAAAHPTPPTEEMQEQISALYRRAWSQMDYVLAYPYTGSVQVVLLHTLYFTQQGKLGIAWSTCGTALRMAESIGLHRHTPSDLQLSDDLVRLRARLWWVAFSLDALLSLCDGRPTGTSSDKTDTRIEPLTAQECPDDSRLEPGPMIYVWHVTLARLVNQVADIIGRENGPNERFHCLAELDANLIAWRDAIPLEFRPEQENLAPVQLQHHVTWLHVQFLNAFRTLHWTSMLLSNIRDQTLPVEKHRRLQFSEAICVASARSLIRTSNSRSIDSDTREMRILGAPSAYFLAATSTLFMHILKEPQRMSAKADVEYLRAGIHHLTSDFFTAQLGQGKEILLQMLQIAEAVTDPLRGTAR